MQTTGFFALPNAAIGLYKKHVRGLSAFTLRLCLCRTAVTLVNYCFNSLVKPALLGINGSYSSLRTIDALWMLFSGLAVLLVEFFYYQKIFLDIPIYLDAAVRGETLGVREAFAKTKGKKLRYCGNNLLLTLPESLLSMGLSILFQYLAITFFTFTYDIPLLLLFTPLTFLLAPMIALEDAPGVRVKRTFALLKGNYWRMLAPKLLFGVPLQLVRLPLSQIVFKDDPLARLLLTLAFNALHVVTIALLTASEYILYRALVPALKIKIIEENKKDFMELLLLADEQEDMIEKYLDRGELFALYEGGLKSICVVTDERDGLFELQSLATYEEFQRKGCASLLVKHVFEHYAGQGTAMIVGTGDIPSMASFYGHCGFVLSHRVENYFVEHYREPMFEDGVQLMDKVYYRREL